LENGNGLQPVFFFAGVGTVVAAMTIGFAGGTMITISPQVEPNRLEPVVPVGNSISLATDIESGDAPALCERFVA
jgi:hypothetical protein